MITIEIFAPPICNFEKIKYGKIEINDNSTINQVLREIELPLRYRAFAFVAVNSKRVRKSYRLKDGDSLSIFMPITGG